MAKSPKNKVKNKGKAEKSAKEVVEGQPKKHMPAKKAAQQNKPKGPAAKKSPGIVGQQEEGQDTTSGGDGAPKV